MGNFTNDLTRLIEVYETLTCTTKSRPRKSAMVRGRRVRPHTNLRKSERSVLEKDSITSQNHWMRGAVGSTPLYVATDFSRCSGMSGLPHTWKTRLGEVCTSLSLASSTAAGGGATVSDMKWEGFRFTRTHLWFFGVATKTWAAIVRTQMYAISNQDFLFCLNNRFVVKSSIPNYAVYVPILH